MAKIIKKKFFEIDIPILNEKVEARANAITELNNKTMKIDATRKLKGKSVDINFKIEVVDGKATAWPKSLTLMPFFIKHMLHPGIDYVEDSFETETLESKVVIKPFFITRKKVSRAVRKTIRNSARNWLVDYLKTKTDLDLFQEILSNQLQKPLSLRLKKIYPLAVCEIRIFSIKSPLGKTTVKPVEKEIEQQEPIIKEEPIESEEQEKIESEKEIEGSKTSENLGSSGKEEKPKKKSKSKKEI